MTATSQPLSSPPTLMELVRQFPEWAKKNVVSVVVSAAVSGVVAYVINVWLMAVRYEGSATPKGAPATSKGNFLAGGLFWALLPMVLCSVVGYWRAVGTERFFHDVRGLPMTMVRLFRRDGAQGRVHLLWGSAIALVAGVIVSPAAGAVLGVGLLLAAPSVVGQMISSLVAQVWAQVSRRVAPTKVHPVPPAMSAAVGLLGGAVALVGSFVVPSQTIRLVVAAACAGAAIYIGQQSKMAGAAALLLLVASAYAVADVLFASSAFADDGGFAECGSTVSAWLENCAGADVVRQLAAEGGLIAALTGPMGTFFGELVTSFQPPGGGSWLDEPGVDRPPRGDPARGNRTDGPPTPPPANPPPPSAPPPGSRFVHPETGEPLAVNERGEVRWKGEWVDPAVAQEGIDRYRQWQKNEEDYNKKRWEENKAWSSQGVDDKVKKFAKEEEAWKNEQAADKAAAITLENIKDIAKKHGFGDIMERADGANVVDPNGTPNEDYINKLRDALRKELGLDKALPPGSTSPDWIGDALSETGKDIFKVANSVPVRIAVGIASGGSSEVIYQAIGAGEKMLDATDKAIANGKNLDLTDFLRIGGKSFAADNLPVNTINNLREGKTDLWSLGTGLAGDAFAILNVRDTGRNINRSINDLSLVKNKWDLLDNLHKGTEMTKLRAINDFDPSSSSFKHAPEGIEVPPERLKDFGVSADELKHAQDVARKADANIKVRPATSEGIELRAQGHPPKPEFIKNKTINDADTYLGARPQDKGLVGAFPPRLPDPDVLTNQIKSRNPHMTEPQVAAKVKEIESRATQRLDEFADQQAKLAKLSKPNPYTGADPKIKIENGVVVDMRPGPGQGKGFTADLDLWDATSRSGGSTGQVAHDALETSLRKGPFDAQHGFHKDWKPVGETNVAIDAKIRSSHGPGGEGLLEVRADGGIKVGYDHTVADQAQRLQTGVSVTGAAAAEVAFGGGDQPSSVGGPPSGAPAPAPTSQGSASVSSAAQEGFRTPAGSGNGPSSAAASAPSPSPPGGGTGIAGRPGSPPTGAPVSARQTGMSDAPPARTSDAPSANDEGPAAREAGSGRRAAPEGPASSAERPAATSERQAAPPDHHASAPPERQAQPGEGQLAPTQERAPAAGQERQNVASERQAGVNQERQAEVSEERQAVEDRQAAEAPSREEPGAGETPRRSRR
ncbi:MAG TPA: hypothetical protein VM143_01775 [Acidimicrobiales bacterium]|nr:hypothetical protein [Acidimicrobiales bacterium]